MATRYLNVPNTEVDFTDGNLAIVDDSDGKRVLVIGTAAKGPGLEALRARTPALVRAVYGSDGSLIRGYYEALASGYENIWLFRVGCKGATVEGIGAVDPWSIYTKFEDAGVNDYHVAYTAYDGHLIVWDGNPNTSGTTKIYDSALGIDLGYIDVPGGGTGGTDIGDIGLEDGVSITDLYADYIGAGAYGLTLVELASDGTYTNPSKTTLFEYYWEALNLLIGQRFERVVLMDVYADDWSIAFINPGDTVEGVDTTGEVDLPTSLRDHVLGWLNVYKDTDGVWQFDWAWDLTDAGANGWTNMAARLSETAGGGVNGPVGCPEENGGYHEVDFAYLLADFCYGQSVNDHECSGVIGVNPPKGYATKLIHRWIGKMPIYDPTDVEFPYDVTTNGSGLLGMPYTVGCLSLERNILARSLTNATFYPGYYATDNGFIDGAVLQDENDFDVDIGRYIDIFAGWCRYSSSWTRAQLGYSDSGAPWYAGFQLLRPAYEAPTNKLITKQIQFPYHVSKQQLDDLVTARMVHFQRKDRGVVVCSACTAAMLNSDFVRRSGTFITQEITTDIRQVCDPFLGNGFGIRQKAALDTAIKAKLESRKPDYIEWADFTVTPSIIRGTLGALRIDLQLQVVNEIGKIYLVVGLTRNQ